MLSCVVRAYKEDVTLKLISGKCFELDEKFSINSQRRIHLTMTLMFMLTPTFLKNTPSYGPWSELHYNATLWSSLIVSIVRYHSQTHIDDIVSSIIDMESY